MMDMSELLAYFLPSLVHFLQSPVWLSIILTTTGTWIIYNYLLCHPVNWCTDFTELGFDDLKKSFSQYKSNISTARLINERLERRKWGEIPPPFPNGWYNILSSDQLTVGGVKEVNVLGLELVAWRGQESGQVYVADAYCPHLGAHLGVGGFVSKECITCPFHAWSFEGPTGQLHEIPYSKSIKGVGLKMKTVLEQHGMILLWYHADNREPSWTPNIVPGVKSGDLIYRGRSEFIVTAHCQDVFENAADVNHLPILHTPCIYAGAHVFNTESTGIFHGLEHQLRGKWWASEIPKEEHISHFEISHNLKIGPFGNLLKASVNGYQSGPGIVQMEYHTTFGLGVLFLTTTPIEPLVQLVSQRFYTARTFIHPLALIYFHAFRVQISRDVIIWNRKMYRKNPLLPKADETVTKYRKWYKQFYSEGRCKRASSSSLSSNSKKSNLLF